MLVKNIYHLKLITLLVLTFFGPQLNAQDNKQAFAELGEAVENYIDKDFAVGGELLVIKNGKPVFHQSYGFADKDENRKWTNNTTCNIRSMTKPITSVAAQILIDRGKLKLDDPVAKHLESFDNEKCKAITVEQVLTHRSGLPLTNLVKVDQFSSLNEQVANIGEAGPKFEPGSKFWYSDIGTDVVAAIVAKVSDETIDQFVQREIFDPLQMNDSFYGFAGGDKRIEKVASLYLGSPRKWNRFWKPEKPLYPFAWGSQTVYSTTTDYAKFLKMLKDGGRVGEKQLISKATVDRMLAPVSRTKMMGSDTYMPTEFRGLQVYYGQMMVTHRASGDQDQPPFVIGHSGSDGTNAWAWPDRDLMILYFTQSRGGTTPLRLEGPIDRLVIHRGVEESVPEELRPFLGTFIANYDNFDNEEFTVRATGGKLILDVPSQMAFELNEPNDKGYWPFAIAPKQIQTEFQLNDDGEVIGLFLHKAGRKFEVPRKGSPRIEEILAEKAAKAEAKEFTEANVTTWNGTLNAGGTKLRLEISISESDGKLTGEVKSLDQNNALIKMSKVKVDEQHISFALAQIGANYKGKLDESGKSATGTFTQGPGKMELTITKSGTKTVKIAKKSKEVLREAWIGELDLGGIRPVMQFRIMKTESGEKVAYFDSVTEGQTGFDATWSIVDDQLSFDVEQIKLTYRGKLNNAKTTAKGTWSQGGRDFPLTLTKSDQAK